MLRFAAPQRLALLLSVVVIAADQISKASLHDYLSTTGQRVVEILPFLNLVAVWNYGVSFGVFNHGPAAGSWVFVGLAIVIVVVLATWVVRADRLLPAAALGLVIGGALGNVIDRVRQGAVFDFIDLHALGVHFWAFNVADSGISIGVVLLLMDSLFGAAEQSKR
jgi:signal peptidase II